MLAELAESRFLHTIRFNVRPFPILREIDAVIEREEKIRLVVVEDARTGGSIIVGHSGQ